MHRIELKPRDSGNISQNLQVMKKPFWNTVVGKIVKGLGLFALKAIITNQKGIKNTPNAGRIDDVFDKLNKN